MKYIDLTHIISSATPVYPGDPAVELKPAYNLDKDGYFGYQVKSDMHIGTHIDAPAHFIKTGKLLSDFSAEKFFGRGVLADARDRDKTDIEILSKVDIRQGDIVIVLTGWYKKFGQPGYFTDYPELTEKFAQRLVDLGVSIIGLDTPGPDKAPYTIHKLLLSHDILIIENLTNLDKLIDCKNFKIIALPTKFAAEAAPCRVIAEIE